MTLQLPEAVTVVAMGGRRWRLYPHPADDGPPLEDLARLVGRAEHRAIQQWIDDHGALPTGRWPVERLFQLPPLGVVPDPRLPAVAGGDPLRARPSPSRRSCW